MEPTPDNVFVKRLKAMDKRLGIKFRHDMDNFVITYARALGPPAEVWVVENEDGSFRQPDSRDIEALEMGDTHRTGWEDRMNLIAKEMADYERRKRAVAASDIRDRTKDDKIQSMRTYVKAFNLGKGYTPFRRVMPKARGMSYR